MAESPVLTMYHIERTVYDIFIIYQDIRGNTFVFFSINVDICSSKSYCSATFSRKKTFILCIKSRIFFNELPSFVLFLLDQMPPICIAYNKLEWFNNWLRNSREQIVNQFILWFRHSGNEKINRIRPSIATNNGKETQINRIQKLIIQLWNTKFIDRCWIAI